MLRTFALVGLAALAACGAPAGPRAKSTDEPGPSALRREPFVVARADAILAIARDDAYLYWADGKGLHRRALGGPDAGKAALLTGETARWGEVAGIVPAGDTLWISDGIGVFTTPAAGGAVTTVVEDVGAALGAPFVITDLARAGDQPGVIAAAPDGLARIGSKGPPVRLVGGQVHVVELATDATHAYWTDYGEDPAAGPQPMSPPMPYDPNVPGPGAGSSP
jgi:hypothetical protein